MKKSKALLGLVSLSTLSATLGLISFTTTSCGEKGSAIPPTLIQW